MALAQNAYCTDPSTRQVDPGATATFQQMAQSADQTLMQRLVGVWYAEIRSPATNQIDYHYQSFEPGGLYRYQSKVCGGLANMCSDYEGTGMYAVRQQGDSGFFGMITVSDLNRDHQCVGLNGRLLDQGRFTDNAGTVGGASASCRQDGESTCVGVDQVVRPCKAAAPAPRPTRAGSALEGLRCAFAG